jgi:hypothetical protein
LISLSLSLSSHGETNLEYRRNGFFRELDKRPNFSVGEENNTKIWRRFLELGFFLFVLHR